MNFEQVLKTEKIRNVVVPRGIQVTKDTPVREVVAELQAHKKICAVVLKGKKVVGIFTERDALKRGLLQDVDPETPIEKLMTADPDVVDMDDSLAVAIRIMHKGNHRHLPIVNQKKEYLGLLTSRDIVYYLSENYPYDVFNQPPDPHKISEAAEGA